MRPPTSIDWNRIRIFLKFLKLFYDATMQISRSLYCTSNDDCVLGAMAEKMMIKYNKYWGDLDKNDKVNLMMFVAVILDP